MPELATAGTMIGAVLETAGYMTQSQFLDDFEKFFQTGGALIYTLAAIGGIFSVVIFGNFKAARYLILGPTIYWFLIGPRTEIDGAIWKMGGGDARTQRNHADDAASEEAVKEVLRSSGLKFASLKQTEGEPDGEPIRVAWVFWWFTHLISEFANSFSDAILQHENDDDLLFIAKTRAFDSLMGAGINERETLRIFQNSFYRNCSRMITYQLGVADPDLRPHRIDELLLMGRALESEGRNNEARIYLDTRQALIDRRKFFEDKAKEEALRLFLPDANMWKFMEQQALEKVPEGLDPSDPASFSQLSGTHQLIACLEDPSVSENCPNTVKIGAGEPVEVLKKYISDYKHKHGGQLQCAMGYRIASDSIMQNAEKIAAKLGEEFTQDMKIKNDKDSKSARLRFCRALARKAGNPTVEADEKCSLVGYLAMVMIKNTVLNKRFHASTVEEHKNNMHFFSSTEPKRVEAITGGTEGLYLVGGNHNYKYKMQKVTEGDETTNRLVAAYCPKGQKCTEDTYIWKPYTTISSIYGHMDAAFEDQQAYQTREIRQRIFTWSMQLPYWQGVILYLISIAYPFLALIVLVPGRAAAFANVPLAWLWVKSWDVGFAFVMVFDKVLWEMFPHSDLPHTVSVAEARAIDLDHVLKMGMQVDPTYNLHAYYFQLSLALMSVPALTGYATLKARRAAVSSFVDGPRALANESAQKAASAYAVSVMNHRVQAIRSLSHVGAMSVGRAGQGITGGGRAEAGILWGSVASGGELSKQAIEKGGGLFASAGMNSRGKKTGKSKAGGVDAGAAAETVSKTLQAGLGAYGDVVQADAKLDAAMKAVYDNKFGRWGTFAMMADAHAAALDGGGGYEINDPTNNADGELVNAFTTRVGILVDAAQKNAGALGGNVTKPGRTIQTRVFGAAGVSSVLAGIDADMLNETRKAVDALEETLTPRHDIFGVSDLVRLAKEQDKIDEDKSREEEKDKQGDEKDKVYKPIGKVFTPDRDTISDDELLKKALLKF